MDGVRAMFFLFVVLKRTLLSNDAQICALMRCGDGAGIAVHKLLGKDYAKIRSGALDGLGRMVTNFSTISILLLLHLIEPHTKW